MGSSSSKRLPGPVAQRSVNPTSPLMSVLAYLFPTLSKKWQIWCPASSHLTIVSLVIRVISFPLEHLYKWLRWHRRRQLPSYGLPIALLISQLHGAADNLCDQLWVMTSFKPYMRPRILGMLNSLSKPFVRPQISLPRVPDYGLVELDFGAFADVSALHN